MSIQGHIYYYAALQESNTPRNIKWLTTFSSTVKMLEATCFYSFNNSSTCGKKHNLLKREQRKLANSYSMKRHCCDLWIQASTHLLYTIQKQVKANESIQEKKYKMI